MEAKYEARSLVVLVRQSDCRSDQIELMDTVGRRELADAWSSGRSDRPRQFPLLTTKLRCHGKKGTPKIRDPCPLFAGKGSPFYWENKRIAFGW